MSGEMRRPPQLWEQRLARTTSVLGVGISSSGDNTAIVQPTPPPGYDGGVEPAPVLPPPGAFIKPSTPQLIGSLQAIKVLWDGLNSDGDLWPYDTSFIEVHMSTSGTGFTPGTATLQGRLARPGGLTVGGLTAGTAYHFKFRGADPAGNYTVASNAATGFTGLTTASDYGTATIGSGAVSFDARQIGGVTNTVGAVAPSNPLLNDVWLDSSPGTAIIHKIWNGSTWVTNAWGSASIAAGQITALQVAAGAITAGAIAAGAITAEKIQAGAVTTDKLTAGTVTGFVIAGGTITGGFITGGTVSGALLAGGTVSGGVVSGGTVSGALVSGGTVSGALVSGGTVSGALVSGGTVSGGFITGGTVNAAVYTGGSISSSTFTGGTIAGNIAATGTVSGAVITGGTISGALVQSSDGAARIVLNNANTLDFYSSNVKRGDVYGVTVSGLDGLGVTGALDVSSTLFAQGISVSTSTADFIGVYNNNTTGLDSVGITAAGRLRRLSSSQAIKYDITTLSKPLSPSVDPEKICDVVTVNPTALLDVAVTEFSVIDDGEPTDRRVLGFIAEDVADKLPIAVSRDANGNPAGVLDTSLLAALVAVVQDQQQQIDDLTARIEALEA